ncbi:MAG: prolyl oligopeptidase family serine peptidase [Steroidobacteraceae bacterium]
MKTEDGFHDLYAMSAYAHGGDRTTYPAVLLHAGANDPRVEPWIVAKMAARLEASSTSGKPIFPDVDYDAGHGFGSQREQTRKLWADQMHSRCGSSAIRPFSRNESRPSLAAIGDRPPRCSSDFLRESTCTSDHRRIAALSTGLITFLLSLFNVSLRRSSDRALAAAMCLIIKLQDKSRQ